jgi:hypothetical protein
VRIDGRAQPGGVLLVEQAIDRVVDKVRIAQEAIAIDVGMAHRLDLHMHRLG